MSETMQVHPSSVPCAGGATVWLTGLPSAGKSTIAAGVADRLRTGLTGVDDEYEVPERPDLVLPTHEQTVESVTALVDHLVEAGITEHPHTGLRDEQRSTPAPSTDEHARTEHVRPASTHPGTAPGRSPWA